VSRSKQRRRSIGGWLRLRREDEFGYRITFGGSLSFYLTENFGGQAGRF